MSTAPLTVGANTGPVPLRLSRTTALTVVQLLSFGASGVVFGNWSSTVVTVRPSVVVTGGWHTKPESPILGSGISPLIPPPLVCPIPPGKFS
jgi:hypothetical protein